MTKEELIKANVVQKLAIANVVTEMLNQRSLGLEGTDLSDLYERAAETQFYFENESYKAEPDMKELRRASMRLDHILSEFMPKGPVEIGEPVLVPIGTVKLPPRPPVQVFYGWTDSAEYPTEAAIIASENFFYIPFGGAFIIPFNQLQEAKYVWFATPDTEPLKTNWDGQNSVFNKGDIGAGNLFGDPIHIGAYYYYITEYPTTFEAPVLITGGGTIPNVIEPGEIPETVTPEPPTVSGNDTTNILSASHILGSSEILVSANGGAYAQYTGPISVGDFDRPAGYWKFKIKAAQYRNESSVANSPAFSKAPVIVPDKVILTIQVNGTTNYSVYVNGVAIQGTTLEVDEGTVLSNVVVVKPGFNITPESIDDVVMDANKTLVFEATEIPVVYPDRTLTVAVVGLAEAYKIFIDGVEQTGPLTYPHGTILDDIAVEIEGYTVTPSEFDGVVMDQNRTVTFFATRITHTLTIDTGGIPGYEVYIDEVLHTGPLVFNYGDLLENISLHKAGYTFTPELIPSVLMDGDKTITFTGSVIPQHTLTVEVEGLASGYTISINGLNRTGNTFTYNEGTVVNEIKVAAVGYSFSPATHGPITMDDDKVVSFVATELPTRTLTINVAGTTGYTVRINGVVQPGGVLSFYQGTVLSNIVVSKQGFIITPSSVPSLTMDADKVLNFTATEDMTDVNYLPGFTGYNPKERYARIGQGGMNALQEISPNRWQINVHRLDFISYIRVPVGGEYAIKCDGFESSLMWLEPQLPWPNDSNKEDYNISGWSGGIIGKDGFYGNGVVNRISGREGQGNDQYFSTINVGEWLVLKRIDYDKIAFYKTNGVTETLVYTMPVYVDYEQFEKYRYMYLKFTIWDDGTLSYPQQKGCFHELTDTFPPAVYIDRTTMKLHIEHPEYANSEILYQEGSGDWVPYTGPITISNTSRSFGYWKAKTKAATGRPESVVTKSPAFASYVVEEGKDSLIFETVVNAAYNAATKTYTGTGGTLSGYKANNPLLLDASAAIYFKGTTRWINLGFAPKDATTYHGDMVVGVTMSGDSEIWWRTNLSGVTNTVAASSSADYRLVCRTIAGTRVWKIEGSTDNWATSTTLVTLPTPYNSNDTVLYPVMYEQNGGAADIVNGLELEMRLTSNVPEVGEPEEPEEPVDPSAKYMPGFTGFDPAEAYRRVDQGPFYEVPGEPGVYTNESHRTDFFSKMMIPVGGEWAYKRDRSHTCSLLATFPNPYYEPDDVLSIAGWGLSLQSSAAGPGTAYFIDGGSGYREELPYPTVPMGRWVLHRRVSLTQINVYHTDGEGDEVLLGSCATSSAEFMYMIGTIWDDTFLSYPQQKGCIHWDDMGEPPAEVELMPGYTPYVLPSNLYSQIGDEYTKLDGNEHHLNIEALNNGYFAYKHVSGIKLVLFTDHPTNGQGYSGIYQTDSGYMENSSSRESIALTFQPENDEFIILGRNNDGELTLRYSVDGVTFRTGKPYTGNIVDKYLVLGGVTGSKLAYPQIINMNVPEVENTTPEPPVLTADDTADTLSASHALGQSEIVMSVNNGTYVPYTGTISVGDVARDEGYWKFKIKSATGRNESSVVNSPAFTVFVPGNTTPEPPTVTADDTLNTLTASHTLGDSEIVFSTNNGSYVQYTGAISVGDVDRAAGYYKFKIKSATGRNESSVVNSPAFTKVPEEAVTVLPGFTLIDDLPTSAFTYSNGINTAITSFEDAINKELADGSAVAFRHKGETDNAQYSMTLLDLNSWAAANISEGVYVANSGWAEGTFWDSSLIPAFGETLAAGIFIVFRRTGSVYTLETTTNGVDFTVKGTFEKPANFVALLGFAPGKTIEYLQGLNLIDI